MSAYWLLRTLPRSDRVSYLTVAAKTNNSPTRPGQRQRVVLLERTDALRQVLHPLPQKNPWKHKPPRCAQLHCQRRRFLLPNTTAPCLAVIAPAPQQNSDRQTTCDCPWRRLHTVARFVPVCDREVNAAGRHKPR